MILCVASLKEFTRLGLSSYVLYEKLSKRYGADATAIEIEGSRLCNSEKACELVLSREEKGQVLKLLTKHRIFCLDQTNQSEFSKHGKSFLTVCCDRYQLAEALKDMDDIIVASIEDVEDSP